MVRRSAKSNLQPLGEVIHKLLKKQGLPLVVEDRDLRAVWNRAVGPQVAAQTSPEEVRKGVLFVRVASSVWMHQLQYLKHEIEEKFNQFSGGKPIKALRFYLGELPPSPQRRKPTNAPCEAELRPRDIRMIENATAFLTDPELRSVVERAMKAEIGRRRFMEKQRVPGRSS